MDRRLRVVVLAVAVLADVNHFSLRLRYDPATKYLVGKAAIRATATVPKGLTVMANGVLVSRTSAGGRTTFVWRERLPMAPQLATSTLGRFDFTRYRLSNGLPVYIAVDPTLPPVPVLEKLPAMVRFYSSVYGPYPFDAVGAVVDDARNVGYSLETQTKPVFGRPPDEATLAHELSHMWYGDSVTLRRWPDIWLHEGLCHLVGVDLERTPRSDVGSPDLRDPLQHPGPGRGWLAG